MRPIVHVLGWLLLAQGALMLLPALAEFAVGAPDWAGFVGAAGATIGIGGALMLGSRGPAGPPMTMRQTFLLTTLVWSTLALFAGLPFLFASHDIRLIDALYEGISGLTTAGGTIISGLDAMSPGLLLWRALLNWIGGIGIIVMALLIFPFLRIGGLQLFRTESSDRSDKLFGQTKSFAATIAVIYVGLTALSSLAFRLAGLPWFDAICHGMSATSTGGFSTKDASLAGFPGTAHYWVATVSMIAGALPMTVYARFWLRGRSPLHDSQVKTFFGVIALSCLVMGTWVLLNTPMTEQMPLHEVIAHVVVNTTSVITTTGLTSADYGRWGDFATMMIFVLFFVGGCTGSTSGAIKIFRWQVLMLAVIAQMRHMVTPHRVTVLRYQGKRIGEDVVQSVISFFVVYAMSFGVLSLALGLTGVDFLTATSGIASSLAGVGPALGPTIGPAGNYIPLPDAAKAVLCFTMILGRLEILTVLILLTPSYWRRH